MYKKFSAIILSFIILIFCTFIPFQEANAFVLTGTAVVIGGVAISKTAIAVGAACLAAAGVTFATNEDAFKGTCNFFKGCGEGIRNMFLAGQIATTAAGLMLAQVSTDMWNSIKDFAKNTIGVGENAVNVPSNTVYINGSAYECFTYQPLYSQLPDSIVTPNGELFTFEVVYVNAQYKQVIVYKDGEVLKKEYIVKSNISFARPYFLIVGSTIALRYVYGNDTDGWNSFALSDYIYNIGDKTTDLMDSSYTATGDAVVADETRDYAPIPEQRAVYYNENGQWANVSSSGAQALYDWENNQSIDIPYTDEMGALNGINTEVKSISAWLTNTWSATMTAVYSLVNSISTTLSNVYNSVVALPQTISTALTDFFTVENLNFDGFKTLVVYDKFPFSIPFDFVEAVKMFGVSSQTPTFDINIDTEFLQVHHTIDLSPFQFYIAFFRYFVVISFIFVLIFATSKFIQW